MNPIIHRLTLDLKFSELRPVVNVRQLDSGHRLIVTFVQDGKPYTITEGCTAKFSAITPEGKHLLRDCTIENNTVIYDFDGAESAVVGILDSDIHLFKNGRKLSTSSFHIVVFPTAYAEEGDKIVVSDGYKMLEEALKAAEDFFKNGGSSNVKPGQNGYSIFVSTEVHPEIGYDVINGLDDYYIETYGRAIQVNDLVIVGTYLYRVTVINDTSVDAELLCDLRGKNGDPGTPGANGKTPYIKDGYWYIDGINTNVKAQGVDGKGIKSFAKTSGNGAAGTVDTYTMTFTDNTTFAMTVYNGNDGYTPQKNVDYFDGNDGFSPTVSVSKSGKVTTITITDKSGTKTATINDGADGDDGKDATANYGVCSTAAGTAAKAVTVDGFELKTGEVVTVKFTATNSVSNPTLNVNNTGAYPMIFKGNSVAAYPVFGVGALEADKLYQFVFTGSNYELVGGLHVDRLAGTNAGYAKSGGDIDFNSGVGTLKNGVVPVKSVNGKTGAVSLNADDVGARASTWMPSASDVGARPNTWTPSYSDVGADKSGAASSAVSGHNTNTSAHNDIRLLIEGLTTRLNTLANSTDEDLDQMAELVAYIKANKALIDSITTSKVSVSDIVNNLTSNVTNKPLSAAQGVALKALIDAITVPTKLSELSGDSTHRVVTDAEKTTWNAKSDFSGAYNDLTGKPTIPTVPTNVSAFTNDAKYLTAVPSGYAKTADHYTKTESDNKYQAKGNYLTSVPSEYVTETELSGKGYLTPSTLPKYDGGVS